MKRSLNVYRYITAAFLLVVLSGASVSAQEPIPVVNESKKITAVDGQAFDTFTRVAVSGDLALVGAPTAADRGPATGKVYPYRFQSGAWIVAGPPLLPAAVEAGDAFGNVVAISGTSALIYAGDDATAGFDHGAVYPYEWNGSTWVEKPVLRAHDATGWDFFGEGIATDGARLAIGAPGDDDAGSDYGTVYVYAKDGDDWVLDDKIVPTDLGVLERFGTHLAVSGNRILAGTIGNGRAFIFVRVEATGDYVLDRELHADDGVFFSGQVALSGDTALVGGAKRFASGRALLFKHVGSEWPQVQEIVAHGGSDPSFGATLALDGNVVVVGAPNTSYGSANRGGVAYAFERESETSQFTETAHLQGSDVQSFDFFGQRVAIDAGRILVGSSSDEKGDGAGAAYYFDQWQEEPDTDGDGHADSEDNCPAFSNSDQANWDNLIDDVGDACDPDDKDGDGLLDSWEVRGVTIDAAGLPVPCSPEGHCALPLPDPEAYGADPFHRDLFLEIDYMTGFRPLDEAIDDVVAAFDNAPPTDAATGGVTLHIVPPLAETDEVPATGVIAMVDDYNIVITPSARFYDLKDGSPPLASDCDGFFGTAADRIACNETLFAKRFVFRYVLFADRHAHFPVNSSGIAEPGGESLLVSLGGFSATMLDLAGGLRAAQAGTLMHELGHTLGLQHGGGDEEGCKPNYISVMNYTLQFENMVLGRLLDFSRAAFPRGSQPPANLDEEHLREDLGILGADGLWTVYGINGVAQPLLVDGAIDWNLVNGIEAGVDIQQEISHVSMPTLGGCPADKPRQLTGWNDWESLDFNFRDAGCCEAGAGGALQLPVPELSGADVQHGAEQADMDGDGFANAFDNCALMHNDDQADYDGDGLGDACDPDDDGDGVLDEVDVFPQGNTSPTVVVDRCDSLVPNHLFTNGATMNDSIEVCAVDNSTSHGRFVLCVETLIHQWESDALMSRQQRGRITRCAAQSRNP